MGATEMRCGSPPHQEDLDTLCRDRPLVTSEIHEPNDFYGQAHALKRYAGFPTSYSLKAVLEHGLFLDDWMWDVDRAARFPLYFSNSIHRASIQERETGKQSIPIGFGFLYAMSTFQGIFGETDDIRNGTIVFPSHSTHHIHAVYDHAGYARKLNELPDRYKPITVCIYWKDFLQGYHSHYKDQGFRVVTAGHIYDPDFLYRFYDICRSFRYSTSNDIGGHLFYSVKAGCRFFYTRSGKINHEVTADVPLGGFTPRYRNIKERSFSLFSDSKDEIDPDQMKFVDDHIGSAHFRTPDELRDLFMYAEKKDKAWNTPIAKNGKISPVGIVPYFWQRKIMHAIQQMLRIGSRIKNRCLEIMNKPQ